MGFSFCNGIRYMYVDYSYDIDMIHVTDEIDLHRYSLCNLLILLWYKFFVSDRLWLRRFVGWFELFCASFSRLPWLAMTYSYFARNTDTVHRLLWRLLPQRKLNPSSGGKMFKILKLKTMLSRWNEYTGNDVFQSVLLNLPVCCQPLCDWNSRITLLIHCDGSHRDFCWRSVPYSTQRSQSTRWNSSAINASHWIWERHQGTFRPWTWTTFGKYPKEEIALNPLTDPLAGVAGSNSLPGLLGIGLRGSWSSKVVCRRCLQVVPPGPSPNFFLLFVVFDFSRWWHDLIMSRTVRKFVFGTSASRISTHKFNGR